MLADVVAIIGEKAIQEKKKKISRLSFSQTEAFAWSCTEPLLLFYFTGTQDIVFGEVDR